MLLGTLMKSCTSSRFLEFPPAEAKLLTNLNLQFLGVKRTPEYPPNTLIWDRRKIGILIRTVFGDFYPDFPKASLRGRFLSGLEPVILICFLANRSNTSQIRKIPRSAPRLTFNRQF